MLKGFYQTDKEWIVSEAKKIFGIDVCPTCHGQLVKAYNDLKNYYKNDMAKKKTDEVEEITTSRKYKLKAEFEGSRYTDGVNLIELSSLEDKEIDLLFNQDLIKLYFEIL